MSGAVERIEAALGAMEAAAKAAEALALPIPSAFEPIRLQVGAHDEPGSHDGPVVGLAADPAAALALVDGLRKVEALHQPIQMLTGPVCTSCGDADEHAVEWPCPTLDALAAALDPGVGDGREVRGE